MTNNSHAYQQIQRHLKGCLVCGLVTFSIATLANANEIENSNVTNTTNTTSISTDEFNADFLIGDAKNIDIGRFAQSNAILPGDYNVDVYINGNWFGKHQMVFKSTEDNKSAYTCFSGRQLLEYGIKATLIEERQAVNNNSCQKLGEWIPDAFYEFDTSNLRFDISIPQVALERSAQGYVDPSAWDRGIDAAFVSYHASAYQSHNKSENGQDSTNAFVSLSTGANIADWQFRHNGQWRWADDGGGK